MLNQGATFGTFTSAGAVRRGLEKYGFEVTKCEGFASKRESLQGVFKGKSIPTNTKPWLSFERLRQETPQTIGVIGGGIAGTSAARALATRGVKVTLFERADKIASGASGNPLALLHPYPMAARSPLGVFLEKGFLFAKQLLKHDEGSGKEIERYKLGSLQTRSSERLKKVFSEISSLDIFPEFCELVKSNSGWEVINSKGQKELFDVVIVCSSYDAEKLPQLSNFKLTPIKGEVACIPESSDSSELKTIVSYGGYILPSKAGEHILGASYEKEDLSLEISNDVQDELLDKASAALPSLGLAVPEKIKGRASIRGSTFDKLPFVGPVPDYDYYLEHYGAPHKRASSESAKYLNNLYMSIGFGSRGFISAQLAAEYLASLICNEPLPLTKDISEALHPGRSLIRTFKKQS